MKKGDKMSLGKSTINYMSFMMPFVFTLCISLAHSQDAIAKQIENDNDITIIEPTARPSEQPKQKTDPFTWAIIGMSLGCMCVASSVHWTLNQRKRIEADIQHLDNFLITSCAVDFHIAGSRDNDPMLHMIKELQENQSTQLQDHASQNDAMVKKISDIESEIMRILG